MTARERKENEAKERLRELLEPGDTIWTVLRHVSRSGMYRTIDCYKLYVTEKGEVDRLWLSRLVARAGVGRFDEKREAVGVSGCGMDMGFHIVNSLSYALHGMNGKGGTNGKGKLDKDPSGIVAGTTPSPERFRAGYSLHHRWL